MKRLLEEYGFSIFAIISGLLIIFLFASLVKNNNIYDNVINAYNDTYSFIKYDKDFIKVIEASDVVINNKLEINKVINNVKAYSHKDEIPKDNIYFNINEIEDDVICLEIIVKYKNDFMSKQVYCYVDKKEDINENII